MRKRNCVMLVLATSLWGGCTSSGRTAPPDASQIPAGVEFVSGLVYGQTGGESLLLDLAQPKAPGEPRPAVIFVHGGGWGGGSRHEYSGPMLDLAKLGFVTLTVDYRVAPKHPFPAALEDLKCAVRWLRAHAEQYNVDPNRIGAFGLSAGAHLVAMLGTTSGKKKWEGNGGHPKQSSAIQAMVCHAGPYDLLVAYNNSHKQAEREANSLRKALEAFLNGPPDQLKAEYRNASPITHVHKRMPPVFLIHGVKDPLIPVEQPQMFQARLRKAGVEVELIAIEGAGHNDLGKEPHLIFGQAAEFLRKSLTTE